MNADKLVPICIESTQKTLGMMAATDASVSAVYQTTDRKCWGEVTGILGLAGDGCRGSFTISFSESSVLAIASRLLMDEFTAIDDDVLDAVGEITNMISGSVKRQLLDSGFNIGMSSPMVMQGKGVPLSQSNAGVLEQIKFNTPSGDFVVSVCFQCD